MNHEIKTIETFVTYNGVSFNTKEEAEAYEKRYRGLDKRIAIGRAKRFLVYEKEWGVDFRTMPDWQMLKYRGLGIKALAELRKLLGDENVKRCANCGAIIEQHETPH